MQGRFDVFCQRIEAGFSGVPEADGMAEIEVAIAEDRAQLRGQVEPLPANESELRDANDLPVLGTLLAGLKLADVNYLVTGDKDLLVLADRFPIITPAAFWERHGNQAFA